MKNGLVNNTPMSQEAIESSLDNIFKTLNTGALNDFLYCIEGGGYKGEFEKDYTLEGCGLRYQEFIKVLQENGCEVKAEYRTSYNPKVDKEYLTKVLVISLVK